MADADEDNPLPPADGSGDTHIDLSDETQDFRFIAQLASENPTIPKRGIKDFEPHGTTHQADLLAESRLAMHNTLSGGRFHLPKSHLVGYWHGHPLNQCEIRHPRGPHFKTMGKANKEGNIWLVPEEMLYLLERGALDVRWLDGEGERVEDVCDDDSGKAEDQKLPGLPMSLQGAYAVCIGDEAEGKISFDRWCVYSGLKRSGYVVTRAPTWLGPVAQQPAADLESPQSSSTHGGTGLFARLYDSLLASPVKEPSHTGPLISPGLYRSYNEIYRLLRIIPFHDPTVHKSSSSSPPSSLSTPAMTRALSISFQVHKPSPTFRKSNPPPPSYHISVLSARSTSLPTLSQLSSLFSSTPYSPPPSKDEKGGKTVSQRLKHGYRNVLLGVVDEGVVSYIRVADSAFGLESITEGKDGAQRKGGGRRGGVRGGKSGRGVRGKGR